MRALVVGAALGLVSSTAWSARPLFTEDAAVQARSECLVDSYGGRLRSPSRDISHSGSLQLGCGVGRDTQAAIGYTESRAGEIATRSLLLSGKTALTDARDDGAGASVAYGVPAEQSTRSPTRVGESFVTLAGAWSIAPAWLAYANLGWTGSVRTGRNTTRWAIALEHGLGEGTALVAETFGDDRDAHPWLQIGASASVTPKVSVNASYGQQMSRQPGRAVTIGFIVTF